MKDITTGAGGVSGVRLRPFITTFTLNYNDVQIILHFGLSVYISVFGNILVAVLK